MRERGVLEPILVRRIPREDGEEDEGKEVFRIISGERRYRAAQEAGLTRCRSIEMDVTEQEALEIALIENLQRKDLTPFEEAEGYKALSERYGYTHEEIAEAVGKATHGGDGGPVAAPDAAPGPGRGPGAGDLVEVAPAGGAEGGVARRR